MDIVMKNIQTQKEQTNRTISRFYLGTKKNITE